MLKRIKELLLILASSISLFACSNNGTTGTKSTEVLGIETNLYLETNNDYNPNSPIIPNDANIYDVNKTSNYFFVINVKIGGGSSVPSIPSNLYSIVYDDKEINLVGEREIKDGIGDYLPLTVTYRLSFIADFNLSPISVTLDKFNETSILRSE